MNTVEIATHLQDILQRPQFLNGTIAGAEVPYFICPYAVAEHSHMAAIPPRLVTYLAQHQIKARAFDVFALCIDLFRAQGYWDEILLQETQLPKDALGSTLTTLLGNGEQIIAHINAQIGDDVPQMIFLHNIGACYPFLRAHALLNHLYALQHRIPVVLFFPGTYARSANNAMALNLFGSLHDNHYYRALNILTVK
jgi:hypothetical protein